MPDIQDDLRAPAIFPEGRLTMQLDLDRFPFAETICEVLTANGVMSQPIDLSRSHLSIAAGHREPDPISHDSLVTTLVSKAFCEDTVARRLYRSLVRMLSRDVLGFDVVFQAAPTFRF